MSSEHSGKESISQLAKFSCSNHGVGPEEAFRQP